MVLLDYSAAATLIVLPSRETLDGVKLKRGMIFIQDREA